MEGAETVAPIPSQSMTKEKYEEVYKASVENPDKFWEQQARERLTWFQGFTQVRQGSFEEGDIAWFLNGKLNVCYNCVDRHAIADKSRVAIIWEGDEPEDVRRITYDELYKEVCRFANALKSRGVTRGSAVCIYMPMVPEAAFAMLACARIGAPHSVVFAGFSAVALRDRIVDAGCQVLITADEGKRGGRTIELKRTVDEALLACPQVHTVFVHRRTGNPRVPFCGPRDVWLHDAMSAQRPYCPPEWMDSEDDLFYLYTSGSTGKPKGMVHSQAGYLLYTSITHEYVFDYRPHEVFACVADIGWITGHSYIIYGPLANGATTVMFESTPLYPDAGRYWDLVQKHKISSFYTAPTAIRAIQKSGDEPVKKYDRSSLRVLGTVGEPINPAAWKWYFEVVGESRCTIVDTYWQTETGGFILTPIPGACSMKPGSATLPFFGQKPKILDQHTGQELSENGVKGVLVLSQPWPGIARTVKGDHQRYLMTYMKAYSGYYLTGDGCCRDKDGFYWIIGRIDDVINVSGHRLGTAELESAFAAHEAVAEAAVVAIPHAVKGQCIFVYVILNHGYEEDQDLLGSLKQQVRTSIGPFATPEAVVVVPGLPKTRSGKIMRRILRKIASQEYDQLGDISTLADSDVVEQLVEKVKHLFAGRH